MGEVIADKYRIERVIGHGGMGVVVAARHEVLEQLVAIKFLQGEAARDPAVIERFRREARIAAKVRSDYVPHVFDVGTMKAGGRFLVMEYLEGHDLGRELEVRGRIPKEEACVWALQVLDAVGRAHKAGIVHRDIKPTNLYLARQRDGSRRIKVLDFGISKQLQSELMKLTSASELMGSPLYMPPEQVLAPEEVDACADLWSLGMVLYEMLSGCLPYEAETLPEICSKLLHEKPTPLAQVAPELPMQLCDVVMNCLVKEPAHRTPSAEALAAELVPFLESDEGRPSVFHNEAFSGAFTYSQSGRHSIDELDLSESIMASRLTSMDQPAASDVASSSYGGSVRTLSPTYGTQSSKGSSAGKRWAMVLAGLSVSILAFTLWTAPFAQATAFQQESPLPSASGGTSLAFFPHSTEGVVPAERDIATGARPSRWRGKVRPAGNPHRAGNRRKGEAKSPAPKPSSQRSASDSPALGEFYEFGGRR